MQVLPAGIGHELGEIIDVLRRTTPQVDWDRVHRWGAFVGSEVESHRVLDRAMERSRRLIDGCAAAGTAVASGTVITAETMTGSKGRFTRTWHAPVGGLWGCMIHANTLLPEFRKFIPMATGISCCRTCHDFGAGEARLRWVNDVLLEGKKIAGFLVESYLEPQNHEEFSLIGFGVNCNNTAFPEELEGSAGTLCQTLGYEVDIGRFAERFLAWLGCTMGLLYHEEDRQLRGESLSGPNGENLLLHWFRNLSDTIGKRVVYGFDVMTAPQYEAQVMDIDRDGGLLLELPDGNRVVEYSGEVRYLP